MICLFIIKIIGGNILGRKTYNINYNKEFYDEFMKKLILYFDKEGLCLKR